MSGENEAVKTIEADGVSKKLQLEERVQKKTEKYRDDGSDEDEKLHGRKAGCSGRR